ncbi:MAG: galactitol-1-phosphate 5-dehydrogenase [Candidatus Brocadiia bacterium]
MKAAVLYGAGDLRVEERPQPKPGPGEALVRVTASGVCNSDLNRVRAAEVPRLPLVIGHEFAGKVVALGEGARADIGARVAVYPLLPCGECPSCRRRLFECCSDYSYYGSRRDGGLADFAAVRTANLVALPDGVSDAEAAMSEPAAVTLHALNRAELRKGECLVILGAGPMGLLAAQIARARGARDVVLLDVAEEPLEFARSLGFEKTARSDSADIGRRVKELAGAGGPEVLLEAAGAAPAYRLALELAAPAARVVFMGNIGGDLLLPQKLVSSILRRQLRILGSWNSSLVNPENEWAAVHAMVARRELLPEKLISHRLRLEEVPGAIRRMQERREVFRKVMVIL